MAVGGLSGIALSSLTGEPLLWAVPISLFVAAYTNAFNFMDGINGISALSTIVAGAGFWLAGVRYQAADISLLGAALVGAAFGFLPMNTRGKIFLGDVGSYSLGALISLGVVLGVFNGIPWPIMIGPLLVYLADTGATLVRRARLGKAVFSAHRSHSYQRLTDLGLSHLRVASLCAFASLITAAGGWLVAGANAVLGIGVWVVALGSWVIAPRVIQRSRSVSQRSGQPHGTGDAP
jgi:UDP-N-acetylmuramyl pentapeptide phosphotransferase/UDP-N-acetylglucosamine-1-phosphate transferase